jgi:hypothetical protein
MKVLNGKSLKITGKNNTLAISLKFFLPDFRITGKSRPLGMDPGRERVSFLNAAAASAEFGKGSTHLYPESFEIS